MGKGSRHEFCCDDAYAGLSCACGSASYRSTPSYGKYLKGLPKGTVIAYFNGARYVGGIVAEAFEKQEKWMVRWFEENSVSELDLKYADDRIQVVRHSDAATFDESFQVGAIVQNLIDRSSGIILHISDNRAKITVQWNDYIHDLDLKELPLRVIYGLGEATFDRNYQVGARVCYERRGKHTLHGTIEKVSENKKQIDVLWDWAGTESKEQRFDFVQHVLDPNGSLSVTCTVEDIQQGKLREDALADRISEFHDVYGQE